MTTFKTVQQAKNEINKLLKFVDLVETYNVKNVDQQIIKEYAYLGSIVKVAKEINHLGYSIDGRPYTSEDVSAVIKSRGNDELHKLIRTGYLRKTRHSRRKYSKSY